MPAVTVKYDSVVELRLPPHLAPLGNGSVSGEGNELSRTPVDSRIGETRFRANSGFCRRGGILTKKSSAAVLMLSGLVFAGARRCAR